MSLFSHRALIIGEIFLALIILLVIWLYLPPAKFPINQVLQIKTGSNVTSVARELKTAGVIRSTNLFQFFIQLTGQSNKLKAGWYEFEKPLALTSVVGRLTAGEFAVNQVKLTIPEGLNATEITKLISQKLPALNQTEFLKLAEKNQGYLFPDTYFIPPHLPTSVLIELMRNNFEEHAKKLATELSESKHSLQEIVTMASLVEEEASKLTDRQMITGILWKRLDAGQKLEVDVATSTYEVVGLPARPIANPSLEALTATLKPQSTSYWFYLSDKNGNIHYAQTFAEHQKNIQIYLKQK